MNIKLALAALVCSVAMSCSVSEGQLLDRMLSKAGCSVCDCGTDTGCSDGLLSGGCATTSCGPGILDKIKGRLAPAPVDAGCGCEAMPVAEPCGCEAPVMESPCDAAPSCGGGLGLMDKLKARLSSIGSGSACAAPADGCGCVEAPITFVEPVVESCGCEAPAAPACGGGLGLLDKLKGRLSSIGSGSACAAPAMDCGCEVAPAPAPCEPAPAPCAPAPVVAEPCGCEAAPAPSCGTAGGGLLDRLKGRLSSMGGGGGCGCAAAPVADDCGCNAPVAAPCVTPAVEAVPCQVAAPAPCGCEPAPAVADCGCGEAAPACGGERPRLSLLDRLRGNRIPRDRSGRVIGGGCNDGCNPPCPNTASPCDTGCGCEAAAPVATGCSSCGSAVMAAPMAGEVIYGDTAVMTESVNVEAAPVVEPAASASDVIEEAAPAAAESTDETPAVDPNAFIIRKGKVNG